MKVAFITDYNNHTWIWAQNYNLFCWLKKQWINIDVINLVSPQWFKEIPNYWINIISNICNNKYLSFWCWVFFKFPKELKKILRKWKYTHIILWHQWLAYLWKTLQTNVKTTIIVHDLFTLYWNKRGMDELIYNHFLLKWIDKIKNIVFISEFTKNDFEKYYGDLNKHNYSIIYQWIDKQEVNIEVKESLIKKYDLEDKKIIINVWSESPRKNIKTYLEVANNFKYNKDLLFVRIWKPSLDSQKYIDEHKLNNILYCSWATDEELIAWYDIAKIVLSTSMLEWYGRQIFEWYLYDNYVVTSNVSDVEKIFKWDSSVKVIHNYRYTKWYVMAVKNYMWYNTVNNESIIQSSKWEYIDYLKFLDIIL